MSDEELLAHDTRLQMVATRAVLAGQALNAILAADLQGFTDTDAATTARQAVKFADATMKALGLELPT